MISSQGKRSGSGEREQKVGCHSPEFFDYKKCLSNLLEFDILIFVVTKK
jgi:hypothetical protein